MSPADVHPGEACLLLRALMGDSRSRVAAQIAGWAHPVSFEWMMLAQLHDAVISTSGVKSPQQYHAIRPWRGAKQRTAKKSGRTREQVRKLLRPHLS